MPTLAHPHSRRRRPALTLASLAALLPALSSRAANVSWSPDADGLWTTPANWSTNSLPTTADDVTLSRGPLGAYTVTLNVGSQSIHSLTANDNLTISSGTLTLSSPSTASASFSLAGGTIARTATGDLTLAGLANLSSGFVELPLTLSPTANLTVTGTSIYDASTIQNSGTFTLAGPSGIGAQAIGTFHNLPGATIQKTGTGAAVLSYQLDNQGSVLVHQGALAVLATPSPSAAGSISVDAGATLSFFGTLAAGGSIAGAGSAILRNATLNGSYSLTNTTIPNSSSTSFNAPSTTSGTLTVTSTYSNSTAVSFTAPTTIGAASLSGYSATYPASVTFSAPANFGSLAIGPYASATFNVAPASLPTLSLTGGTATFNAPSTLPALALTSGTLAGSADVSLAQTNFTWTTGSFAGTGRLVVPPGSAFTTTGTHTLSKPLAIYGSLADTGTTSNPTNLHLNASTLTIQPGATYTLTDSTLYDDSGTSSLVNAGTLAQTGTLSSTINVPVTNSGVITAPTFASAITFSAPFTNAGTLSLSPTGPHVAFTSTLTNTGTFAVAGSACTIPTLLNSGTVSLQSGTLTVTSVPKGTPDLAGTYSVSGGTLYLPKYVTSIGPTAFVSLNNSSNVLARGTGIAAFSFLATVQGSLSLDGPNAFINADASLTNTGSLTLSSGAHLAVDGTFRNAGHFSNAAGTLTLSSDYVGSTPTTTVPLIWDYTGQPSPIDTLRAQLRTGYNNGTWTGTGIQSYVAQSDSTHLTAVAYAEAPTLPAPLATQLNGGTPPDPTTLLTKLTSYGDANLDGRITPDDYALLDRSFAQHLPNPHWTDGDFNYDGTIDQNDYLLIDTTYLQQQGGAPSFLSQRESQFGDAYVSQLLATVPEPSSLLTACTLALPLFSRFRTKSKLLS